jgi:hypothetical protein
MSCRQGREGCLHDKEAGEASTSKTPAIPLFMASLSGRLFVGRWRINDSLFNGRDGRSGILNDDRGWFIFDSNGIMTINQLFGKRRVHVIFTTGFHNAAGTSKQGQHSYFHGHSSFYLYKSFIHG